MILILLMIGISWALTIRLFRKFASEGVDAELLLVIVAMSIVEILLIASMM